MSSLTPDYIPDELTPPSPAPSLMPLPTPLPAHPSTPLRALAVIPANIPPELQSGNRFTTWRLEPVEGKPKPRKVPYTPLTGRCAKSNDPTTWVTWEEATVGLRRYSGLMLALTPDDGIFGLDLDNSVDEDGGVKPWAQELVDRFASYTELSPSGRGLHILGRGKPPTGKRKDGDLEVFGWGFFLTLTGHHLPGTPRRSKTGKKS